MLEAEVEAGRVLRLEFEACSLTVRVWSSEFEVWSLKFRI